MTPGCGGQETDKYAMHRELGYRIYLVSFGNSVRIRGYGGKVAGDRREEKGRKGRERGRRFLFRSGAERKSGRREMEMDRLIAHQHFLILLRL